MKIAVTLEFDVELAGSKTETMSKDASMTSWTTGENGIPTGWTVVNYQP